MKNEQKSINQYLNGIYILLHKRNNNSNLYTNNFISTLSNNVKVFFKS